MTEWTHGRRPAEWTQWGQPKPHLSSRGRGLLRREVGATTHADAAPISAARLTPSALSPEMIVQLERIVGTGHVRTDDEVRARHAGGQSYQEIVRRRAGDAAAAPDAVVWPSEPAQIADLLRACAELGVAVVPWGGGTSVVGGLANERGRHAAVIALDLSRLDQLLSVDEISLTATFQPGMRTPDAEAALTDYGLTLGHMPQSFERASLGGYVVTRSAGQSSTGVGRIDDLVAGLRMATPTGEMAHSPAATTAATLPANRYATHASTTIVAASTTTSRARSARSPASALLVIQ